MMWFSGLAVMLKNIQSELFMLISDLIFMLYRIYEVVILLILLIGQL